MILSIVLKIASIVPSPKAASFIISSLYFIDTAAIGIPLEQSLICNPTNSYILSWFKASSVINILTSSSVISFFLSAKVLNLSNAAFNSSSLTLSNPN